jgi:hypothetical protein
LTRADILRDGPVLDEQRHVAWGPFENGPGIAAQRRSPGVPQQQVDALLSGEPNDVVGRLRRREGGGSHR